MIASIVENIGAINWNTVAVGAVALALLLWIRLDLKNWLNRFGLPNGVATVIVRARGRSLWCFSPWPGRPCSTSAARAWHWWGRVPQGLPMLALPSFNLDTMQALLLPALIISVVGFVESISVAQTLAAKRRERIDPNQELIGLGASNLAAAIDGGYPVTGGLPVRWSISMPARPPPPP